MDALLLFFIADLTHEGLDRKLMRGAMLKSALNPALPILAIGLALVSTTIAITLLVGIPLMFFLPSKLEKVDLQPVSPSAPERGRCVEPSSWFR
jgi:hypothetical protein